jgi:lipopolysaccharide export system permease protein
MIVLRYIVRTVAAPFAALLLVVTLVSSAMQLSRLGEVAFGALGDVLVFARLTLYVAPTLAGVALPIALLLACLIAYDRLADSGELFALAASGVSSRRLFAPAIAVGLPVGVLSLWLGLVAVPWGIDRFLDEMAGLATRAFSQALVPRAFNEVLGTTALYASDIDQEQGTWRGVFLAHAPGEVQRELLVLAPEVSVRAQAEARRAVLRIEQGEALVLSAPRDVVERVTFAHGEGVLDLSRWAHRETAIYYDYQAHDLGQLLDDLGEEQRPRDRRKIAFFMWQKLTLPFGCLPLALLGALLGAGRSAEGRARAYVWGVLAAVLFFVGHEGARGLAADGFLDPAGAAWAVVLGTSVVTLLLWWRRAGLRQ